MSNQYSLNKETETEIVWLRFFERWTIKAISEALRLSKDTVLSVIKRRHEQDRKALFGNK